MKKSAIAGMLILGIALVGVAALNSPQSPNVSQLVGTFLPGLFCMILAAVLRQSETAPKLPLWKPITAGLAVVLIFFGGFHFLLPHLHSEDEQTAWTYQSSDYGFKLSFPSSEWKEFKHKTSAIAFVNAGRRVFFGVNVKKESQDDFRSKSVEGMKKYFADSKAELLSPLSFQEGKTGAGNPYALWSAQAKAGSKDAVFGAMGLVWYQDKGLTISFVLEGELKMASERGKAVEIDYFTKAATAIFLSVE